MRTFEEIDSDLRYAYRSHDTDALRRLADEMRALSTPESEGAASRALGAALAIDGKYREALAMFRGCRIHAEERGDLRAIALSEIGLGNAHKELGEYAEALPSYERACAICRTLNDVTNHAIAIGGIGVVYTYQGRFDEALEALQEAARLYESLGDQSGAARIMRAIGGVYHDKGDLLAALECFKRSLHVHEMLGEHLKVAACMGEMGNVYMSLSDFATALEQARRALAMYEQYANKPGIATSLTQLGSLFLATDDYVAAMEHYQRALAYAEEMNAQAFIATMLGNIGNVHARTGNYEAAMDYMLRALANCEVMGDQPGVARICGNLGSVYGMRRDWDKALSQFQRSVELFTSLNDRSGSAMMEGNLIITLLEAERFDDAADRFFSYAELPIIEPEMILERDVIRARIAEHRDDLETAQSALLSAFDIACQHGLRLSQAQIYQRLRDLAQKRNDFASYIEYNQGYQRLIEEITGKEVLQRLAVQETERRIEQERLINEKNIAVLHSALPPSIADRLVRGERVDGDHFDNAALMFLDIVGFTTHTSHLPPAEVVKMLENIFRTIDGFCANHNVVKIKTIGDSYMCFRGDADARTNALSIMHVALEVMEGAFTWPNGDPLQFRAGIHVGPVTAGVIGTQRLQYDVWGDTVNVASRMESTGEPGRIHVSEAFARSLAPRVIPSVARNERGGEHSERGEVSSNTSPPSTLSSLRGGTDSPFPVPYSLRERGALEIKGKGMMTTYWLEPA